MQIQGRILLDETRGIRLTRSSITTWYGMRYAVPPMGNNRWRAPLAIQDFGNYSAGGIQDASSQGPACVQGAPTWYILGLPLTFSIGGQEDCLTVDVFVPSNRTSEKLPVWVEIHGGGYTAGSAASMPGNAMVNQSNGNLIFVQVQYRLGALGFLNSDEVKTDGTANAGLLDQRLALQWVQKYIDRFGGDSSQVTVHGGSAGGGSVINQLIMYGGTSSPPFRAAVAGECAFHGS